MLRKHFHSILAATLVVSGGLFAEEEIAAQQQYPNQMNNGRLQNPSAPVQGQPGQYGSYSQQPQVQYNTQQNPYNNQAGYGAQQSSQIQWVTNYRQAADQARKDNKYILLFFTGSDWCGWCKKMVSEVFSDPEFARAVGNQFVFVELDFPMNRQVPPEVSQQNTELKQRFGISGYPTVVVLDPNQNFVAETGYRPGGGGQYANYLMQLVQKGAQR